MHHSKQRYLFVDLLRFIAVVFMIQGHTFDALLDLSVKSNTLFYIHDFFHGFIAPMFLFASGVAFGISTLKKWEHHIAFGSTVYRRIGKFIGLILVGYSLHLPFFSLQKIINEATTVEISAWLQVDALHCIAVTLLFLQILAFIIKKESQFVSIVGISAVIVIFLSPIAWTFSFKNLFPLWCVSYFNGENSSWFPLFPWSAYIFSGVFFASLFINAKEHHHAVALMQKIVTIGVVLCGMAILLANLPFRIYPTHDFWKVNPAIFMARLGFVGIVTSGVFFAEHSFKFKLKFLQIIGRESLFIYVLHLLILYGSVANKGLQFYIGPTLSVFQTSIIFFGLFGIIVLITIGWHELKIRYYKLWIAIIVGIILIFLYQFVTRPY
jgi:uncharacterized membrane protein